MVTPGTEKYSFVVPHESEGLRLDVFLHNRIQKYSRAFLQKLIEGGSVLLNNHESRSSHKVHLGDRIDVSIPPQNTEIALEPWDFPIRVLYEDADLAAVHKPPRLVVHPGAGRSSHTLVHALLFRFPEILSVGHPRRPGIVHRLDKETSGLLLVARSQVVYLKLTEMFQKRKIKKHYRALAFGTFGQRGGRIEKGMGRDPRNRQKISVRARKKREAVTLYHVLRQFPSMALLDVQILTGRTHQIRVHLSSEGHPVVGDTSYGGGNWQRISEPELRTKLKRERFFGLHAFSLEFDHPVSGRQIYLEDPLPEVWNNFRQA